MTNFELVQNLLKKVDQIESDLKSLRDNVGMDSKKAINAALSITTDLNQKIWEIDKSLDKENLGNESI